MIVVYYQAYAEHVSTEELKERNSGQTKETWQKTKRGDEKITFEEAGGFTANESTATKE